MKKLLLTVLVTVFFGCFLGKAQRVDLLNPLTPASIPTNPANISQLEVTGKSLTQNSQNNPTGVQITGSFGPSARWNSMGNIPATTQTLNGFRTQTDGRGLAWGHSIPAAGQSNAGIVSNSFIEWIGNKDSSVTPGNLEFRYGLSPTGASAARVRMFTMAPTDGTIPSFNYADSNAFVGQKQNGTFGNFGGNDIWSATGQLDIPGVLTTYGSRHQYKAVTLNLAHIEDANQKIKSVLDFGSLLPAISASQTGIFQFRTFTNPTNSSSIKNVWQSGNNYGNVVFGRQDYSAVNSANFYVSVFDGVASHQALLP